MTHPRNLRLPALYCRVKASRAVVAAFFTTFFQVFNVPVFWPILVVYFFVLFALSMKQQIKVWAGGNKSLLVGWGLPGRFLAR